MKLNHFLFIFVLMYTEIAASENGSVNVEGSTIIGNNEQPKALFIVPWQAPPPTAQLDEPFASQVVTMPKVLYRDEFLRRVNNYYDITAGMRPSIKSAQE